MRKIVISLAALLGFLIGLPALALGLLHTGAGARFVEAQVTAQTDGAMVLEGLDVHGFLDIRLARFAMEGIEVEGLALDWSPSALLSRKAEVHQLTLTKLTIAQTATEEAEAIEAEADAPFALPELPELPVAVAIEELSVETLVFAAPAFGLEGRYTLQGRANISRTLGAVEADIQANRLSGKGVLKLTAAYGRAEETIRLNLNFVDEDGAPLAALTGYDGGALSLNLTAEGPLSGTQLTLNLALANGPKGTADFKLGYDEALKLLGTITVEPMGVGGPEIAAYLGDKVAAEIEASLAPDGAVTGFVRTQLNAPKLQTLLVARTQGRLGDTLKLNLDATEARLADLPPDLGAIDLQLRSLFNQSANALEVDALQVKAAGADIAFKGTVPLDAPYATQLEGLVALNDLAKLAPDMKGSIQAEVSLKGSAPEKPVQVAVNAKGKVASGDMALMDVVADVTGTVATDGALDLSAALSLPSLTPLNAQLKGAMTLDGTLRWVVGALQADAKIRTTNFVLEGAPVTGLMADVALAQKGEALDGKADVLVETREQPVSLTAPFSMAGDTFTLNNFALTGPGVNGGGTASYNLIAAEGQGRIDLALESLGELAALVGMEATGQGRVGINLNGSAVSLAATLSDLGGADLGASAQQVKANLTTSLGDPMGGLRGQVKAEGVAAGGAVIPMADLDLLSGKAGPAFALTLGVAAPVDLEATAKGAVALGDATKITLTQLDGVLDGERFALAQPTHLTLAPQGPQLANTLLKVGAGEIAAAFAQGPEKVSGRITLTALDLSNQLPNGLPLTLGGVVTMEGASHNPTIVLDIHARAPIETMDEELQISAKGQLQNQTLAAQLSFAGAGGDLVADVKGAANANLRDGVFGLAENQPLTLTTQGAVRLAPFAFLIFDDGSTMRGAVRLEAAAVLAGAPERMEGRLCLQNFAAGLVASGTSLRSGNGCLELSPNGALAGKITATDGHSGKLDLTVEAEAGTLLLSGLTADKAPKVSAQVALSHFRVMDGDLGLVKVDGAIKGEAALEAALTGSLSGVMTVEQGDLIIPANPGPSFTPLEVRHVGRPQDAAVEAVEAAEASSFGTGLDLDMQVKVPGRFFVRGRGIESEWKGDVGVTGTLAAPIIAGKISMLKGQATTGAAVLSFNRGDVTLVPDPPAFMPIVLIDMVSEANVEGTTARMTLAGPVTEPKISFSSDPTLPEDEILARLLFGKPAAQLTASEALSMAGAALELSGTFGGGPGVMGKVRRGLGVDRLSVDASTDAPNSSSISAGKYITPELYLSVKQAADGTAPDIAVEYEVTDEITVTGEQEGEDGESVGVRYEYDY